jgi:hypothetical protein
MSQTRGIYRVQVSESGARYAWVEYGTSGAMEVPEHQYRAQGYEPPFDSLPWKHEYDAERATADPRKAGLDEAGWR